MLPRQFRAALVRHTIQGCGAVVQVAQLVGHTPRLVADSIYSRQAPKLGLMIPRIQCPGWALSWEWLSLSWVVPPQMAVIGSYQLWLAAAAARALPLVIDPHVFDPLSAYAGPCIPSQSSMKPF